MLRLGIPNSIFVDFGHIHRYKFAMKFFSYIFITTIITLNSFAIAEVIEGRVFTRKGSLFVEYQNQYLNLNSYNYELQSEIRKLKNGDFISGTGSISHSDRTVFLESISSVGLFQLLGVWRTETWDLFEFRDFNRLNLYFAQQNFNSNNYGFKPIKYSISPYQQKDTWSILMVDDKRVEVGRLTFKGPKQVYLEILDQNTGQTVQNVDLFQVKLN